MAAVPEAVAVCSDASGHPPLSESPPSAGPAPRASTGERGRPTQPSCCEGGVVWSWTHELVVVGSFFCEPLLRPGSPPATVPRKPPPPPIRAPASPPAGAQTPNREVNVRSGGRHALEVFFWVFKILKLII